MDVIKIGNHLSFLRQNKGWTQDELAATLNISRQAISKWENAVSIPDLDMLLKLSELYGITVNDILVPPIRESDNLEIKLDVNINSNKSAWNSKAKAWNNWVKYNYNVFEYVPTESDFENEEDLSLIGDVKGKDILELGCGSANNGIVLALKGANVTGLDLSHEQLIIARENSNKHNVKINLFQGSMDNLSMFKSNSFDIIISIMAMNYIGNIKDVFMEVRRVLKPNGIFIYSACHPIYDAILDNQFANKDSCNISYFEEWSNSYKWKPEDDFEFVEYLRPISSDINALSKSGLFIENFMELKPVHSIKNKNEIQFRVPKYMVFKTRKILI